MKNIVCLLLLFFITSTIVATPSPNKTQGAVEKIDIKEQLSIGKKIYRRRCAFCHASGAAGSPKIKDKKQWEKRYKQGMGVLVHHVTKGYHLMPPKGTCSRCTPHELKSAVRYLLHKSGAS
ncbi:MAG: cytochrome c5 family protein [Gammaproteobacteria bacterium]|nr:cytochrome c5 family protein [Gammaproteobacteria bacterium]